MGLLVDIRKDFGPFRLNVDFEAGEGVTGLLGASGCGKSVTLRCIAGVERPDSGHIELNGRVLFDSKRRIDLSPQRRRVGCLFQNYALFPNMTVEANIAAGVRERGKRRAETERLMASFRLEECRGKYPRQLSGGQQQRAALARILASRPEALLLDEPFSALDSYLKGQIEVDLMERLARFSGPVLFVSHSREEICGQCGSVCVLDRGRSQPVQTVRELFEAPATLAACRLSGCENLSQAKPLENGRLEVPDWGGILETGRPLPRGMSHVGIRAEHLRAVAGPGINRFSCRILRRIHEPHRAVLLLKAPGENLLRMAWPAERAVPAGDGPFWVELPPERLLLLTER